MSQTTQGMEYGWRDPIWMLKSLITNVSRDQLDYAIVGVIDYLRAAPQPVETETVFQLLAQLAVNGQVTLVHSEAHEAPDDEGGSDEPTEEQLTEEAINAFRAMLGGMPTAEDPFDEGDEKETKA